MQFTPQQLSGAGCYNSGVRLGNWLEDLELEKASAKAYATKQLAGARVVDKSDVARRTGTHAVRLSRSNDGFMRYGFNVCLTHEVTGACLASSLSRPVPSTLGVTEVEASATTEFPEPVSRTTFVVRKADGNAEPGDCVRYGDEVHFATEPSLRIDPRSMLCQDPLFLLSSPTGLNGSNSASNAQEVRVAKMESTRSDAYIRWRILPLEVKPARIGVDQRVPVCQPIKIEHSATGKALAVDQKFMVFNDFGRELEVFCENDLLLGKMMLMNAETSGVKTGEHRRVVGKRNWWSLRALGPDEESAAPVLELENITVNKVLSIAAASVRGVDIASFLGELDFTRDGVAPRNDVKWKLKDAGADLSTDEFTCLLDAFSQGRRGINLSDLIAALEPAKK